MLKFIPYFGSSGNMRTLLFLFVDIIPDFEQGS